MDSLYFAYSFKNSSILLICFFSDFSFLTVCIKKAEGYLLQLQYPAGVIRRVFYAGQIERILRCLLKRSAILFCCAGLDFRIFLGNSGFSVVLNKSNYCFTVISSAKFYYIRPNSCSFLCRLNAMDGR